MSVPSPVEFYNKYKNDPEEAKRVALKMGREIGNFLKEKKNIKDHDLEAVARILNAAMEMSSARDQIYHVVDDKVIMESSDFCQPMRISMTLDIPWEWLDVNWAWPLLEGIASSVIPEIYINVPSARSRGDPKCIHVFERRVQ